MSELSTFAGSDEAKNTLHTALQNASLPHAVLICAPDGCGRNHFARCLAADYLYPEGGAGAAAVLRGESTEVLLAEGEGKKGQIPVARIRAVRSDVFLSSLSAAGRVVHIRDAHRMAAPAYNALLKVLEEPPSDVLFILTAQSAGALPATIVSRCACYRLVPLSPAQCRGILAQHSGECEPTLPDFLAAVYDGRLGLCLAALGNAPRMAILQDAAALVKAATAQNEYALLCLLVGYESRAEGDRERRENLLFDVTCILDAALRGVQAPGLPTLPAEAAALLLGPVAEATAALGGNAAPKITLTALVVALARAGAPL